MTFQDEKVTNESEVQKILALPDVIPTTELLNPPKLETGKLEGKFNDKDFTGQPSTLEKEVKINKKEQQKALIVIGAGIAVAVLIGAGLYVMSKKKK